MWFQSTEPVSVFFTSSQLPRTISSVRTSDNHMELGPECKDDGGKETSHANSASRANVLAIIYTVLHDFKFTSLDFIFLDEIL
jgi:hypothetical protein